MILATLQTPFFLGSLAFASFIGLMAWSNRQFQKKLENFHQRHLQRFAERSDVLEELLEQVEFSNEIEAKGVPPRVLTGYPYAELEDYRSVQFRVVCHNLSFLYSYKSVSNRTYSLLSPCCSSDLIKEGDLAVDAAGALHQVPPYTFSCASCGEPVGVWPEHRLLFIRSEPTEERIFEWLDTFSPGEPLNNSFRASTLAQDLRLLSDKIAEAVAVTHGLGITATPYGKMS